MELGMRSSIKSLIKRAFLAILAILWLSPQVSAAFLEALWGARPAALAGAFTATADDANAPAYNPAGVSLITRNEITFMYARLFAGVNLYSGEDTSRLGMGFFSYSPSIKNKAYGSYAISWTNLAATNLYREDSFALSIADSYQFDSVQTAPILSYGTNLKLLRRSFSTDLRTDQDPVFRSGRDSSALTFDAGLILRPNWSVLPGLNLGLAGQNLTEPNIGLADRDRVPLRVSFGVAYHDAALPLINPSLEVARRNGRTLITGAWEAWLSKDTLAFRVGANEDEIGSGLGYKFRLSNKMQMRLDYAILWPLNVEGTTGSHRVSISTAF